MASETHSTEQANGKKHTDNSIEQKETLIETKITDLPKEVLVYLLNKIDKYDDLMACTQVSRKFFMVSSWLLEDRICFVFNGAKNNKETKVECKKAIKRYGGIREARVRLRNCHMTSCGWFKGKITSRVTCLELNCCHFTWEHLGVLLANFENLEELSIAMNLRFYNSKPPIVESLDHLSDFAANLEDLDWNEVKTCINSFVFERECEGKLPKATLKRLNVDIMFSSATSLLLMLISNLYKDKIALEEFSVKIYYEEIKLQMYDKGEYYQHPSGGLVNIPGIADYYAPVRCADLLRASQNTLKKLSFCCSSSFPYAGGWPTVADDEDTNQESALRQRLAEGLFEDLFTPSEDNQWTFPNLQTLSINVPLFLVSKDTYLLNCIESLVKLNSHMKNLELKGVYLRDGEENLIKGKFILPNVNSYLGFKTVSLKTGNIAQFSKEVEEITVDIMGDCFGAFGNLFKVNTWQTENNDSCFYKRLKCLSIANGSFHMATYGFIKLLPHFPNLTELCLRDLSLVRCDRNPIYPQEHRPAHSANAKLLDRDMQSIFQNLQCLERLHLHCDMFNVTDYGLTGISEQACSQILAKPGIHAYIKKADKVGLSFSALKNLKHLFLFYTGTFVTEITARFAFKGLTQLEYFKFDSCSLNYRDRILMYRKILSASPSCHVDKPKDFVFSDKIN